MRWLFGLTLVVLSGTTTYVVLAGAFSSWGHAPSYPISWGLALDPLWQPSVPEAALLSLGTAAFLLTGLLFFVPSRVGRLRKRFPDLSSVLQAAFLINALVGAGFLVATYFFVKDHAPPQAVGAAFLLTASESALGILLALVLVFCRKSVAVFASTLTLQLLVAAATTGLLVLGSSA
jgi:hypothetical protein